MGHVKKVEICSSCDILQYVPACDVIEEKIDTGNTTTQTLMCGIQVESDLAYQESNGDVDAATNDIEMGSATGPLGMRWAMDIPQGATITNATIQFTSDEANAQATILNINGEDVDNAAPFVDGSNGTISSRTLTTANVVWNVPVWLDEDLSGPEQRTPDISTIIQEIVDRPGWTYGNDLALIIDGTGERWIEGWNGAPGVTPILVVEFEQDLEVTNIKTQGFYIDPETNETFWINPDTNQWEEYTIRGTVSSGPCTGLDNVLVDCAEINTECILKRVHPNTYQYLDSSTPDFEIAITVDAITGNRTFDMHLSSIAGTLDNDAQGFIQALNNCLSNGGIAEVTLLTSTPLNTILPETFVLGGNRNVSYTYTPSATTPALISVDNINTNSDNSDIQALYNNETNTISFIVQLQSAEFDCYNLQCTNNMAGQSLRVQLDTCSVVDKQIQQSIITPKAINIAPNSNIDVSTLLSAGFEYTGISISVVNEDPLNLITNPDGTTLINPPSNFSLNFNAEDTNILLPFGIITTGPSGRMILSYTSRPIIV